MQRAVYFLGVVLAVVALLQVHSKAKKGRQALIKWTPDLQRLGTGESIYGRSGLAEGYPTPPLSALLLKPLAATGPIAGSLLFGLIKVLCGWYVLRTAIRLSDGTGERAPPDSKRLGAARLPSWGPLVILLLSTRVLLSDMAHGNTNLAVAATVCACAIAWSRGNDAQAGLWAALGATLKVTPAIALLFFLRKRSSRALAGFAAGLGLFLFVLPATYLGWGHNLALLSDWWTQMITPFVEGAPLSWVQTQQINQSLLGVSARLLTDSVAIVGKSGAEEARVALIHLNESAFRWLFRSFALLLVAAFWFSVSPKGEERSAPRVLAEFTLLALLALFLSERSWKHHWVLLPLPIALMTVESLGLGARKAWAYAGLAATTFAVGLTGSGVLGKHGSNLAEAYGAFFWAGLVLFAAACRVSAAAPVSRRDPAAE